MKLIKIYRKLFGIKKSINSIENRNTDVYLVSYPKSGNTWMRFLLINYLYNKKRTPLNYSSLEDFIPSIYKSSTNHINSITGKRIIKSHSVNNHYPKVIYLVRDGRDAMVSYYYFQKELDKFDGTFREFYFTKRDREVGTWSEHIFKAFDYKKKYPDKILFIKYEDLKKDEVNTFKKVIDFLGYDIDDDQLSFSLKSTTFKNLKKMQGDNGVEIEGKKVNFFRKGTIGNWKEYFDDEIEKDFYENSKKCLETFDYNIEK